MRSRSLSLAAPLVLVLLAAGCSGGAVTVSEAWARPAAGLDQPDAAYLVISNRSGQADALLSVSSPDASSVEMHESGMDSSGMMAMRPVARIEVPAGATVTLEPGGLHLMLVGLTAPLPAGGTLQLDLRFEHAGTISVQAAVRAG
ncbi:MAG: copper chaperone PCu(A)C [Candidatus Limnocylindrales bacterium]